MKSGLLGNTAHIVEKSAWLGIAAAIATVAACGGGGGNGGSGGSGGDATTSSSTSTTSSSTSTTSTGTGPAHLAEWGRKFLGTEQTASSVAVDAQGNIYVGGSVAAGMVDFGAGQHDCPAMPGGPSWCGFLLKLDPQGNTLWSHVFSADYTLSIDVTSIGVTSGGIVIAAQWQRRQIMHAPLDVGAGPLDPPGDIPMVLARFDPTGKALWSAAYGDDSGYVVPASLVVDGSDSFTVGGTFSTATLDFGAGPMSFVTPDTIFLAHFDGTTLGWQKSFAGMTNQALGGFGRGPGGELLLAGTFEDSLDFGGPALSGTGIFQAKLSAGGAFSADSSFDVTGVSTSVLGVAADAAGNTLVTGMFDGMLKLGASPLTCQGDLNGYLAKIDASGKVVFAQATTEPMMSDDGTLCVTTDASNNVIWGSNLYFTDHQQGSISKLDPTGAPLWTVAGQNFGARAFAVDASGNVIAVGEFTTEIDFVKGGPITATMGLNAFVAKFSP